MKGYGQMLESVNPPPGKKVPRSEIVSRIRKFASEWQYKSKRLQASEQDGEGVIRPDNILTWKKGKEQVARELKEIRYELGENADLSCQDDVEEAFDKVIRTEDRASRDFAEKNLSKSEVASDVAIDLGMILKEVEEAS